ncbi:MAG: hypothetical protein IPG50_35055 [Myxococcales bacterium]|nr:hypothetical protein [Myxococcales bacterium]
MNVAGWFAARGEATFGSPALRAFGAVLAALHVLTAHAWFRQKHIVSLVSGEDVVCWPLFADCWRLRAHLTPGLVRTFVGAYVALALLALWAILRRRSALAFASFVATFVVGLAIYSLDYRLRFNQSYMLSWVIVVLLLAPRKLVALQALLPLFYFWAGTLKMNSEWISGSALYAKPSLVPDALIPAACVYVLVLELAIVWGLYSKRTSVRLLVLAQLALFHAVSFAVVGFFYPLLMFGLLALFPIVWRLAPDETLSVSAISAVSHAGAWRTAAAVAVVFSLFQLVPYTFPGDPGLTGEGRLFALHMFDAKVECEGGAVMTTSAGERRFVPLINLNLEYRVRCDPIVIVGTAERLCRLLAARGDAARVDVSVDARRSNVPRMAPLVRKEDFCAGPVEYSMLRHNPWIVTP